MNKTDDQNNENTMSEQIPGARAHRKETVVTCLALK